MSRSGWSRRLREREGEWKRVERDTVREREGEWERVERETVREWEGEL